MDIAKVQKSLATKALYQQHHRFNDLYRYVRHRDWLEAARHDILQNSGANTPGIDGVRGKDLTEAEWQELINQAIEDLRAGTYQPLAARRKYIPKANGGERPLGIPTIRDRMVQEALRMVLEPIYESHFMNCSNGFRPKRSTMTAIHRIQYLSGFHTYYWAVEGDIKGCFDNIPHAQLLQVLRQVIADERLLDLIWAFLQAGYQEEGQIFTPNTGTPQGGIVSPLLANIYLHEMDKAWWQRYGGLSKHRKQQRRKAGLGNIELVRYADDFVLLTNGPKAMVADIKVEFGEILDSLGLTLSPEKTHITHVNDGYEFLGFHIQRRPKRSNPQQYALYVTPTQRNVQRYKDKIRHRLATTHGDPVNKIRAVNRVVRGWANYYRHVQSSHIRQRLDYWTFMAMWRWLGRKHSGMPRREMYNRYILLNAKGKKVLGYGSAHLTRMGAIAYRRYYLPKGGIQNPYLKLEHGSMTIASNDPLDDATWDGTSTQKGFALIRQDLLMQCGPICHQCGKTFPQHKLHAHHVKAQKDGGRDRRGNLILLCQNCHPRTPNYGSKVHEM